MNRNKIVAMIPARMGSSRFPGKPLERILGIPLIEHTRRRVCLCDIVDEVYVATCDEEIRKTVESAGGKVIMTRNTHERCTDRIEEAASHIDADIIINVQGDEPLIMPDLLRKLVEPFDSCGDVQATCLIYPISDPADLEDINTVKAVLDLNNCVLYFSRSPIPNFRHGTKPDFYEQSGVMAYRKDFLHRYSRLHPTPLEKSESVDMLRILEHGYKIYGVITENVTIEVDLPEHIAKVEAAIKVSPAQSAVYEMIRKI